MEIVEMVWLMSVPDGMLQESVNKLVAGLGGGLVAWFGRKWYIERKQRGSKLNKVHDTLFGMDDVHTMEGVVEVIEAHEEDIEELNRKIEEYRERQKDLGEKVEDLAARVRGRKQNGSDT